MKFSDDYMVGRSKRAIRTVAVAEEGIDEYIVGSVVPDRGGAGRDGALGALEPWQRFVVDPYSVRRILSLLAALRHYHGNRFPDIAGLVGGQHHMAADKYRAAARAGQFHVELGRRHSVVRERAKTVGETVGPGEYR